MSSTASDDLGKLVLRLSVGILVLLHGIAKLGPGSMDRLGGALQAHGLPAFISYGAYAGEIIGPLLVILGLRARLGAWLIVVNMLFAVGLVHMNHLFELTRSGGWTLELQAMFLFGALAIALMGAGRYSVSGQNGRWN